MDKNEILENISDAPNFYLSKFRFGELTPSAAKLFCQYHNFTDLDIAQDRFGKFFWVAFPPGGVMPEPISPLWKEFYRKRGKRWINNHLQPKFRTTNPYYIVHLERTAFLFLGAWAWQICGWTFLFEVINFIRNPSLLFNNTNAIDFVSLSLLLYTPLVTVVGLRYWLKRNNLSMRFGSVNKIYQLVLPIALGLDLLIFFFIKFLRY